MTAFHPGVERACGSRIPLPTMQSILTSNTTLLRIRPYLANIFNFSGTWSALDCDLMEILLKLKAAAKSASLAFETPQLNSLSASQPAATTGPWNSSCPTAVKSLSPRANSPPELDDEGVQVVEHRPRPRRRCPRAGNRPPLPRAAIVRETHGGLPLVDRFDGLEPDPSVSMENSYAPGVGPGSASGEIRMATAGDHNEKGKGAKNWKIASRRAKLKVNAAPLLSQLSDISISTRELELCDFS